jgi:hypothetical protein
VGNKVICEICVEVKCFSAKARAVLAIADLSGREPEIGCDR